MIDTQPATPLPALLDDKQGAAFFGVGLRTFIELQAEPWFPKPVALGPRLKRHSAVELAAAIERMPRIERPRSEPLQLAKARATKAGRTEVR